MNVPDPALPGRHQFKHDHNPPEAAGLAAEPADDDAGIPPDWQTLLGHPLACLVFALTLAALHSRPNRPILYAGELRRLALDALDAEAAALDVFAERDEAVWGQAVTLAAADDSSKEGRRP